MGRSEFILRLHPRAGVLFEVSFAAASVARLLDVPAGFVHHYVCALNEGVGEFPFLAQLLESQLVHLQSDGHDVFHGDPSRIAAIENIGCQIARNAADGEIIRAQLEQGSACAFVGVDVNTGIPATLAFSRSDPARAKR